jgi:3-hydroxybutyryl-CoA dehydratase
MESCLFKQVSLFFGGFMIRKMNIGDTRSYERIITTEDIMAFGKLTTDMNRAHFCKEYTKDTAFKKPIVHGMLVGSLFSCIFGTDYPGEGTIYCSQSLKFLKPVYPDTLLMIKVTVKDIMLDKNRVVFTTEVFDENETCLLTGEAMLMPRRDTTHG